MRKACLYVQRPYLKNEIFNENSILNRDQCLKFFHELKKEFLIRSFDLQTHDLNDQESSEIIIFSELPGDIEKIQFPKKSYLFLFESELIRPNDWNLNNHKYFKKIFTWNDTLVDNIKYFKFNFTHSGSVQFIDFKNKKKLCTLIAGHKYVNHPLELYSSRIRAIKWFEQNQPFAFDFYGVGWDQHTFNLKFNLINKVMNRLSFLKKIFSKKWPSYKGQVESKLQVLKKYKFSICFENAKDIPGYITEKIFDSMAAGCIPVYWGAPNIIDFIPSECFINFKQFNNFEELYSYLSKMTEDEFQIRISAIEKYLKSELHLLFDPTFISKKVVESILDVSNK